MDFNKKIWWVEDSQFQRTICVSQLKQAGFQNIEVAGDGNEAYSKLEEDKFDLILCDWEMPELNGIQLLKKIKKIPTLQNIPFIMLTSMKDEKYCQEAIDEGALDFIVKPANPDLFKEKLEKIDWAPPSATKTIQSPKPATPKPRPRPRRNQKRLVISLHFLTQGD